MSADFFRLAAGENSDGMSDVKTQLDGDVDGVWPNGTPIKASASGLSFTSGVFKLNDTQNTDIDGDRTKGYTISDYEQYYPDARLPRGWCLPSAWKKE